MMLSKWRNLFFVAHGNGGISREVKVPASPRQNFEETVTLFFQFFNPQKVNFGQLIAKMKKVDY